MSWSYMFFFLLLFHLFYFFFLSERQVNWWVFVNLNTFKYILRHQCVWVICYGIRAANFCASQRQSECRQFVFDVSVFGLRTHVLMEAAKWKRIWCVYDVCIYMYVGLKWKESAKLSFFVEGVSFRRRAA